MTNNSPGKNLIHCFSLQKIVQTINAYIVEKMLSGYKSIIRKLFFKKMIEKKDIFFPLSYLNEPRRETTKCFDVYLTAIKMHISFLEYV